MQAELALAHCNWPAGRSGRNRYAPADKCSLHLYRLQSCGLGSSIIRLKQALYHSQLHPTDQGHANTDVRAYPTNDFAASLQLLQLIWVAFLAAGRDILLATRDLLAGAFEEIAANTFERWRQFVRLYGRLKARLRPTCLIMLSLDRLF